MLSTIGSANYFFQQRGKNQANAAVHHAQSIGDHDSQIKTAKSWKASKLDYRLTPESYVAYRYVHTYQTLPVHYQLY